MFRAVQERDPGFHGSSAGGFGGGEEAGGWGEGAVVPRAGPPDAIESAAGSCVLWCTVAVGCLVGGRPKSSVSSARDARSFSNPSVSVVVGVVLLMMFAERSGDT